jgi:Uma2 family endonuclease
MTPMSLPATGEILNAAEHLPVGATLVVPQVPWDDYERLLANLAERPRLRVSYDCGRLEIVSPLSEHGEYESLIEDLVRAACQLFRLRLEKRANATWKKRSLSKGAEADASYYIANAQRIIGKRTIDLDTDPPPDIVVEIDVTNDSFHKFPIYAALAVPEVWRYDGQSCRFYRLAEGQYTEASVSRFLPALTGQMISEALELGKTEGQDEALRAFRRNVRKLVRTQ